MIKLGFITLCLVVAGGATRARSQTVKGDVDVPSVTLPPELDRVLRDYERAWRAHDATALAGLFAEDGYVLSNGAAPVKGRDAIRVAYGKAGGPLDLRAFHYSIDGSVGFILGAYRHGPSTPEDGKFTLSLRRDSTGKWLIVADMDNANGRRTTRPVNGKPVPIQPKAGAAITEWIKNARWSQAETDSPPGKFTVRWRTPLLAARDVAGYDRRRVSVAWPFASQGSASAPTAEEESAMGEFEKRLCSLLQVDACAALTAVVTGDGARQWVFRTEDVDESLKRLVSMLHPEEKRSIEVMTESDPKWSARRDEVLRRVQEMHD